MSKLHFQKSAGGFSLIEVLLAAAIMSFGLLALASLQVSLIRSSSDAKAQTIALGIAKDKIEELKNYRILNEANSGVSCPSANDSYQCINTGSSSTVTESGVVFTPTWTVERFVVTSVGTPPVITFVGNGIPASGSGTGNSANNIQFYLAATPRNEFKTVAVKVSWADATGATKMVTLKDAISALQPKDSAALQKPNVASNPRPAIARINDPGLVAGVIPIAVGGGTSSAATNPRPTQVVNSFVVETRFDILTYSGINGSSADAQSRVETVMVGCKCDFANAPASTVRGYRPTYWNGKRYVAPEVVPVVSPGYSPPAGIDSATSQSARCTICCRDHHDPVGTDTAGFSPYRISRNSSDVVTAAHPHYNANLSASMPVTTGVYNEACRVVRVDGIFRVAPDYSNDYFGLLATRDMTVPANNATSPIPDPFATKRYQNFVVDYVDARYTNTNSESVYNTPSLTNTGALEGPQAITVSSVTRNTDLNEPGTINISVTSPATVKTLHSRGLYVDFLEQEAIDAITDAKTSCASQSGQIFSECVLKVLPFTSINLTELADWRDNASQLPTVVADDSTVPLTVTNNNFSALSATVHRAEVKAQASSANASGRIYSFGGISNSGLLDLSFEGISFADTQKKTDSQLFRINPNGAVVPGPFDGSFTVDLTPPTGFVGTPAVNFVTSGLPSEACSVGSPVTNNTCVVANSTATSGVGVPGTPGMTVEVLNYNRTETTQQSSPSISNCTGTGNASGFSQRNSGTTSYSVNTCTNYAVSSAINTNTGETYVAPSANINVAFDGDLAERTRIAFALINNGNVISVLFNPTPTVTTLTPNSSGGTCTFTCGAINNSNTNCDSGFPTNFTITTPSCP